MGQDIPDEGKVTMRKDIQVSYLPQAPQMSEYDTVLDTIFNSSNRYIQAVKDYELSLENINHAHTPQTQQALEKAIEQIDALNAWNFESTIKEILSRLDIRNLNTPISHLSGGQRKKVALSKALIEKNDLLILDEPTNHLDIAMIEWLEEFLLQAKTTLLMVTHDRYFLDNICDEIIEIEHENAYRYRGKYAYYIEKKAERIAAEKAETAKAKNLYRTELEWMRRMPQARGGKAKARIDAFYELKEKASKRFAEKQAGFSVKSERLGSKILEINNLSFSYPDGKLMLDDFSYTFKRGERIGVVGANGSGKSTFLKLIMEQLRPTQGRIVKGQTIKYGYYSQDGLKPDPQKRVIDIIKDYAERVELNNGADISVSQFLLHFGFSATTQYAYYENLSGGEKRKLHLLITLIQNPNFLILDEPTNDFDIETLNLLEDFLLNFSGCLLIVSHDRYFLNKIADHLFIFQGNGKVKDYYGAYTEYRREAHEQQSANTIATPKVSEPQRPKRAVTKLSYKEKKELESLETEIAELEAEKQQIETTLSSGSLSDNEELVRLSNRFSELMNLIDEKTNRWLELSEKEASLSA